MLQHGKVWFLVADGRRARALSEPERGATLVEAWTDAISDDDRRTPQDRPPRSFDSVGPGRHAMDGGRTLHEQEEVNFLMRIAARVHEAGQAGAYDHLVIAAPPRALGILRAHLSDLAKARLRVDLDKDLLDEPLPRLRERLREALMGV
ncbi:MAG: host attachment protein [Hyphomonadaceae bacterium]|nr:host attachment protein [Hyphomonadaceae bacterium]